MKDIVEYLSDMRWDIPGPIRQGALDEIDRLRSELAAMCENHQAAVAHYRKRDAELAKVTADHKAMAEYALKLDASNDDYQAELAAKDARITELEGLLKRARDHIGSMPAIKPDGRDCFFATLKLINEVEQTLGIA